MTPYSDPRRRARTLLLVAGSVFVVLVGAAALLVRLGQPTPPSDQRSSASGATAATTTEPLSPGRSPGQSTAEEGRDEVGATAAAVAYAVAPQEWLYMSDDEVQAAVVAMATPSAADRLGTEVVDEIAAARAELVDSAGPVWWIVHPLATKVEAFTPAAARATVSVWVVAFLSAADVAVPQTEWTTTTFDLEWSAGAWRVAAVMESVGPTPAVGPSDQPWEPEPLDDALEGFTRLAWGDFR
jgi:hypothetical protein